MNPRKPYTRISYNGKDISSDMSEYLMSVTIVDKTITDASKNESDELTIDLEDSSQIWISDWMPSKGDELEVEIGYEDESFSFGTFEIDEIEYSGAPETVSIKAVAAGISRQLRSRRSTAHEGKTLKEVAEKIAEFHKLTVEGEIEPIQIGRVTQDRMTDLQFLARLAEQYGYIFSIRGTKIVFTQVYEVQKQEVVTEIDRLDMISFSVKDSSSGTASSAVVNYHDFAADADISFMMLAGQESGFDFGTADQINLTEAINQTTAKNDVVQNTVLAAVYKDVVAKTGLKPDQIQIRKRVENKSQAEKVAKAALHKANSRQVTARIEVPGDPKLMAGANVDVTGLRKLSGKYHMEQVSHRISRNGGYTCELSLKKVANLKDSSKQAPRNERANSITSQP
jgi:phage protein D